MALLLTQKKFAQVCGITPQGVHRAIKNQRVHLTRKKIDPNHPTNLYFQNCARNRKAPALPEPGTPVGPKPRQQAASAPKPTNGKTTRARAVPEPDELYETPAGAPTRNEADLQKILAQLEGLQIKNAKDRDKLIDRNVVRRVFSELYTVETSEFLTLGEKLAPEIAAATGLDDPQHVLDICRLIQVGVSEVLEHVELKIDNFLGTFQIDS